MITSLQIKNFRCVRDASLSKLKRINIVVGSNSSGKTTILEALFMILGNGPSSALKLRTWRRLPQPESGKYVDLWNDLFWDFDTASEIGLNINDSDGRSRRLRVYFGKDGSFNLPLNMIETKIPDLPNVTTPINFSYKLDDLDWETIEVSAGADGLKIGALRATYPCAFLSPVSALLSGGEYVNHFSALSQAYEAGDVLDALRESFPQIKSLSIQLSGQTPRIFADLRGGVRQMPLELVSSGIGSYLNMLIAIAVSRNGMVILDEIENGIHHSILPAMVKNLVEFSRKFNVQLFVSTHSYECLRAFSAPVAEHPSQYSLIRATKSNGASGIEHFQGDKFEVAIREGVEVR